MDDSEKHTYNRIFLSKQYLWISVRHIFTYMLIVKLRVPIYMGELWDFMCVCVCMLSHGKYISIISTGSNTTNNFKKFISFRLGVLLLCSYAKSKHMTTKKYSL